MGRTSSKDPGRSCKGHRLVQLTNIDNTQQRPLCCCGHFAQCKYRPFAGLPWPQPAGDQGELRVQCHQGVLLPEGRGPAWVQHGPMPVDQKRCEGTLQICMPRHGAFFSLSFSKGGMTSSPTLILGCWTSCGTSSARPTRSYTGWWGRTLDGIDRQKNAPYKQKGVFLTTLPGLPLPRGG